MGPPAPQGPPASHHSTPGLQGHNGHSHGPSPHQGPLQGLLQGPGHPQSHQGPPQSHQGPQQGLPQGLQALPISQGLSLGMVPVTVPVAPDSQVGPAPHLCSLCF